MKQFIVLLGAPGAGKGTQSALLSQNIDLPHISTGDMLRGAISAKTPMGLRIEPLLARGELVSDDLMLALLQERLSAEDCTRGAILDGWPRTVAQAEMTDATLLGEGDVLTAISLTVPLQEVLERIAQRAQEAAEAGQPLRADDTPEVAADRQRIYAEQTAPVLAYYKEKGCLQRLEGVGDVHNIQERLLSLVKRPM